MVAKLFYSDALCHEEKELSSLLRQKCINGMAEWIGLASLYEMEGKGMFNPLMPHKRIKTEEFLHNC